MVTAGLPPLHDIHHIRHAAHRRSQSTNFNVLETRKAKEPAEMPSLCPLSEINSYREFARYTAHSYCTDIEIGSQVGSDGTILWRDGDGSYKPRAYIAYSPSLGLVVGHEGTNKTSILSIAFDIDFAMVSPRIALKWLGPGVRINKGLQQAWNETSTLILTKMLYFQKQYPDAPIVTTGHSLGAATALLGALELSHHLNVSVKVVAFGLPRLGNQKFADAVDRLLPDVHHIVHHDDIIPHVPPRLFGFRQVSGEVWIADEGGNTVYQCQGQEDKRCAASVSFFDFSAGDHHGQYFGLEMSCEQKSSKTPKKRK